MHTFKVKDPAGLTVGSGEIVALTAEQLAPRAHRVELLDEKPSKLNRVRVIEPIQFKAGEELQLERAPKDGTGTAALAKPPAAAKPVKAKKSDLEAAHAAGIAEGRKAMLAEVEAYNAALDKADEAQDAVAQATAALEAEPDPEKRKPLEKAVEDAQAAAKAADEAAAALQPMA